MQAVLASEDDLLAEMLRLDLQALLQRYQRSEGALVTALTECYVQGVSTRKARVDHRIVDVAVLLAIGVSETGHRHVLVPTLRPGQILVLDNPSPHKSVRIPELIEAARRGREDEGGAKSQRRMTKS